MSHTIHARATTTPRIRAEIQQSSLSQVALAKKGRAVQCFIFRPFCHRGVHENQNVTEIKCPVFSGDLLELNSPAKKGAVLNRLKPLTVDQLANDLVMDFD